MENSDFDWVKARSECTVDNAFACLRKMVKKDLGIHQTLNPGPSQGLRYDECDADRFFVEKHQAHRVIFERKEDQISISRWSYDSKETPLLKLSVGMNEEGNCVLTDKEKGVLLPWQARKIALERTFFGGTYETHA